jgi:hypothetical protein
LKNVIQILCVLGVLCGIGFAQDREAFTVTRWQLDVQIAPADGALSASGRLTLRNDSLIPMSEADLQISSTLAWQSIEVGGRPATFTKRELPSAYDHTDAMSEAVIALPRPIKPQETIDLDVAYGGTIPVDARRLTDTQCQGCKVNIPLDVAEASDWDAIDPSYTMFRGAGYVTWYPIAIEPASLSDPANYFGRLGAWRERHNKSALSVDVCVQALQPAGFTIVASGTQRAPRSSSTRAKCTGFDFDLAGEKVPVLAAAPFGIAGREHATAYYLGARPAALDVLASFEQAEKDLETWFMPKVKSTIVQLPGSKIAAFESGTFAATPFDTRDQLLLETNAARQVAHASFASPRLWLDEGVAQFAQALVQERAGGRKGAIAFLNVRLPFLLNAEAEAYKADAEHGDPLVRTHDDVTVKLKGMFVLWMLRDIVGDDALQRALAAYQPGMDKEPSYIQRLLEQASKQDLEWFFDDWVYRDHGLPEFKIVATNVRPTLQNTWTVEVTVENSGGAVAEVPVMVQTEQGEKMDRLRVRAGEKAMTRITVPAPPVSATVNDGSIPEANREDNTVKLEVSKK